MDWYPWYPVHYKRDTLALTFAEDGAYRRLIDEYMILRGPLPDDDRALARLLGVSFEDWTAVAATVRRYFKAQDGVLIHKRCERELAAQKRRSERYSERGRKAAFGRYSKIKPIDARSMLVPATRQDKERKRLPREEGFQELAPSSELEAIMSKWKG